MRRKTKTCPYCGVDFTPDRVKQAHCRSEACAKLHRTEQRHAREAKAAQEEFGAGDMPLCIDCGCELPRWPRRPRCVECSRKFKAAAKKKPEPVKKPEPKPNPGRGRVLKICIDCKNEFAAWKQIKNQVRCPDCQAELLRQKARAKKAAARQALKPIACDVCGEVFQPVSTRSKYCCRRCYQIGKAHRYAEEYSMERPTVSPARHKALSKRIGKAIAEGRARPMAFGVTVEGGVDWAAVSPW